MSHIPQYHNPAYIKKDTINVLIFDLVIPTNTHKKYKSVFKTMLFEHIMVYTKP